MGEKVSAASSSVIKLKNQEDSSYLQIHPQELHFPFELNKQISCSLQLSNKSDNYVAFKVKTTIPQKYSVKPNNGVLLPRSTCDIIVTMKPQKMAPPNDMQCNDKFLIQSIVASSGATTKDITSEMFYNDSGYEVEVIKLRAVYVARPLNPQSPAQSSLLLDQANVQISKLTKERNQAVEKNKKLEQELREAKECCSIL